MNETKKKGRILKTTTITKDGEEIEVFVRRTADKVFVDDLIIVEKNFMAGRKSLTERVKKLEKELGASVRAVGWNANENSRLVDIIRKSLTPEEAKGVVEECELAIKGHLHETENEFVRSFLIGTFKKKGVEL